MNYVVANLHGEYERFQQLLHTIRFSENDILYVLGDSVDYGEQSAELITDMSMRTNVYPIAGEHDFRALRMLAGFSKMLETGAAPDADFAAEMTAWAADGGQATLAGFRALDADMREGMLDYLSDFALYEEVRAGGKDYVLVHAGIADFDPDTALDDYEPEDFFVAAGAGETFFDDRILVVGHAPTESGKIERDGNVIRIDCGAANGGRIGCLCLETGEEFYV